MHWKPLRQLEHNPPQDGLVRLHAKQSPQGTNRVLHFCFLGVAVVAFLVLLYFLLGLIRTVAKVFGVPTPPSVFLVLFFPLPFFVVLVVVVLDGFCLVAVSSFFLSLLLSRVVDDDDRTMSVEEPCGIVTKSPTMPTSSASCVVMMLVGLPSGTTALLQDAHCGCCCCC